MFNTQEKINKLVAEEVKKVQEKHEQEVKTLKNTIESKEREIYNLKEDNRIVVSRKEKEIDNKIYEKTSSLRADNDKLKVENQNLKKEVEILTKAFENLGFDVKDMKDILNKLVDGVVSKNQIQLVK